MRENEIVLTSEQMRQCDAHTIHGMGVPSMVLMERAALAAVDELLSGRDPVFDTAHVLCLCGAGNNGGDGAAVARILSIAGVRAEILFLGDRDRASVETARQLKIAENYGVEVFENPAPEALKRLLTGAGVTTIVDALFGIGLSRPLAGIYEDAILACNASPARLLAVDIPSGVSADTGEILGVASRADKTVVLAFQKWGMTVDPGKRLAGKTVIRDIGITRPGAATADVPSP